MKVFPRIVALVLFLGVSLSADTLETVFFRANLSPANEVPPITTVTYSGRATIAFHLRRNDAGAIVSGVVDFDIDYNFADAVTITGLHIHEAGVGVNGPIRIESGISNTNTLAAQGTGNIFRQVNVDSGTALAALGNILANPANFYVNLHTSANTGGVMRDQMTRMEVLVVRAILDPANEVPPIVGLNAGGSGSIFILATRNAAGMITSGTLRYDVSYRFPGAVTIRGLHIHPGVAGANGPAVLDTGLNANNTVADADGAGTLTYKVEVTSGQALDVLRGIYSNPANAYLNLHTTDNTGGAMRGQLQAATETSLQFPMSSEQESPPVQPPASGLAKVSVFVTRDAAGAITSGTALFDVNYTFPGPITLRGFHIHSGASGANGPVNIDSGLSGSNTLVDDDGVGNLYKIIDVGPTNTQGGLDAIRSILATPENQYLNIHSTTNTGGHIRGQLGGGQAPLPAISGGGIVNATFGSGVAAASPGSLISIF
ncbi:MAG TPA: CHRD domain-containing protein, partial [Terriglobia bacterium]